MSTESQIKKSSSSSDDRKDKIRSNLLYGLNDKPTFFMSILLGLQHYITMLGGTVTYPYILTSKLCMRDGDPAKGSVIATTLFCSGVATYIQTTFGIRLPIVQGATFTFLVPTLAILSLPQWACPSDHEIIANRFPSTDRNLSFASLWRDRSVSEEEYTEVWESRMREISGAILLSSLVEVILGATGLIGFLMRFITPLSIVPTISLIGLSLFKEATAPAGESWIISGMTIILVILFSQYLTEVQIPIPIYGKEKGIRMKRIQVLITITISWTLCYLLTLTDALPAAHPARTDGVLSRLISRSPWIRIPYPFQFGFPTFSSSAVLGMTAGVIASALESVGDYYAAARLCSADDHASSADQNDSQKSSTQPSEIKSDRLDNTKSAKQGTMSAYPPPNSAINRGIFMEGIGCMLSGIMGSGGGLTSYSENIGALGITKVASRHVVQTAAILMIFLSLFVKVSAILATIPVPIIGGILMTMFGICSGVGLSSLQFIDLNSSRNLTILGTSLFLGLSLPKWILDHPDAIKTGNETLDQVLFVLMSTSMLVGGLIGCLLDNTIPGTDEERGVVKWKSAVSSGGRRSNEGSSSDQNSREERKSDGQNFQNETTDGEKRNTNYDLPPLINGWMISTDWMKFFPMSPTFDEGRIGKKMSVFWSNTLNKVRRRRREETKENVTRSQVVRNTVHLEIN